MDRDVDTLTVLLMDPFLTRDEAEREAAAVGADWELSESFQDWCGRGEYTAGHDSHTRGRKQR